MKQTAVEWLFDNLDLSGGSEAIETLNKAKEMEKEQMHKCASFWRGKENEIEKPIFEQYYNETFKSK
jgi:hypothetical protein